MTIWLEWYSITLHRKEIINGEFDEAFWKQVTTRKVPEAEAQKILTNFAIEDDEALDADAEAKLALSAMTRSDPVAGRLSGM